MIKNANTWQRQRGVDPEQNIITFRWMVEHAISHGKFPRKNMLDGLEEKIKLAKALNVSARP
jgi:hypothetical protein